MFERRGFSAKIFRPSASITIDCLAFSISSRISQRGIFQDRTHAQTSVFPSANRGKTGWRPLIPLARRWRRSRRFPRERKLRPDLRRRAAPVKSSGCTDESPEPATTPMRPHWFLYVLNLRLGGNSRRTMGAATTSFGSESAVHQVQRQPAHEVQRVVDNQSWFCDRS